MQLNELQRPCSKGKGVSFTISQHCLPRIDQRAIASAQKILPDRSTVRLSNEMQQHTRWAQVFNAISPTPLDDPFTIECHTLQRRVTRRCLGVRFALKDAPLQHNAQHAWWFAYAWHFPYSTKQQPGITSNTANGFVSLVDGFAPAVKLSHWPWCGFNRTRRFRFTPHPFLARPTLIDRNWPTGHKRERWTWGGKWIANVTTGSHSRVHYVITAGDKIYLHNLTLNVLHTEE